MKKTIPLLLIVLLLFNAGGGYLLFWLNQSVIRLKAAGDIEKNAPERELVLIAFPLKHEQGLTWERPGKEFTYRGHLYDVVKIVTRGNMKYYHCFNDTREKRLIAYYQKSHHSKKESEKRRKAPNNFIFDPQKSMFTRALPLSCFAYSIYEFQYSSKVPVTPSPPPKIAWFFGEDPVIYNQAIPWFQSTVQSQVISMWLRCNFRIV